MMSAAIKGKTIAQVQDLSTALRSMMAPDPAATDQSVELKFDEHDLGELVALMSVKRFPVRIKCATLSWHTLDRLFAESVSPS